MEAINKRVVKLIELLVSSKKEFSDRTGISPVILSHINSGRNKVSLGTVQSILNAFPQISSEWLVMGQGEVFKDKKDFSHINSIIETLNMLQNELKQQERHNTAKIEHLTNQLRSFTDL